MNRCVPDFAMNDDYGIPTSTVSGNHGGGGGGGRGGGGGGGGGGLTRPRKITIGDEDEIVELLWQDGQVVLNSQNQRSSSPKKLINGTAVGGEVAEISQSGPAAREIRSFENVINLSHQQQLFMQEDEMASWLQYPLPLDDTSFVDHRDLYSDDLLYTPLAAPPAPSSPPSQFHSIVSEIRPVTPPPMATSVAARAPRPPPIPTPPATETVAAPPSRFQTQNFTHFTRLPKAVRIEPGPSSSPRELTVVDSNETSALGTESRVSHLIEGESTALLFSVGNVTCGTLSATAPPEGTYTAAGERPAAFEPTVTSSPGGSGGSTSASAEPTPQRIHNPCTPAADRKRKGIETDETECHSEDIEFESAEGKKQAPTGSTSTKRSRAAEVHNLSERRRRDRINERMRALQELIPRCNKSDKASMLDEAIEYLKSLQLQIQMMAMGCGMLPLMYPGMQQYMPAAMGMGMGMEMGLNRPLMPFQPLIPTSGMPNPAVAAANMGSKFPVPPFHMQPVPVPDSSGMQAPNQMDPMLNSLVAQNPNQARMPNFAESYQQFISLQQAQMPLLQNQVGAQPDGPSSSRGVGNPENHQSG